MLRRSQRIKDRSDEGPSLSIPARTQAPQSGRSAFEEPTTAFASTSAHSRRSIAPVDALPFSLDFDSDAPGQNSSVSTATRPRSRGIASPKSSATNGAKIHFIAEQDSDADLKTPRASPSEEPGSSGRSLERTPASFSPTNLPTFNSGDGGYVLCQQRQEMLASLNIANQKLLRKPEKRVHDFEKSTSGSTSTGVGSEDIIMGEEEFSKTSTERFSGLSEDDDMQEDKNFETIKRVNGDRLLHFGALREIHKLLLNPLAWPEQYSPRAETKNLRLDDAVVTLLYRFNPKSTGVTFDFGLGHYWWRCEVASPIFHVIGAFPSGPLQNFTIQRVGVEVIVGNS